jgi:hypothetical protein
LFCFLFITHFHGPPVGAVFLPLFLPTLCPADRSVADVPNFVPLFSLLCVVPTPSLFPSPSLVSSTTSPHHRPRPRRVVAPTHVHAHTLTDRHTDTREVCGVCVRYVGAAPPSAGVCLMCTALQSQSPLLKLIPGTLCPLSTQHHYHLTLSLAVLLHGVCVCVYLHVCVCVVRGVHRHLPACAGAGVCCQAQVSASAHCPPPACPLSVPVLVPPLPATQRRCPSAAPTSSPSATLPSLPLHPPSLSTPSTPPPSSSPM